MAEHYIFLHGLGLSNSIWEPLIKFAPKSIFAPNLPGHGKCSSPYLNFSAMWKFVENTISISEWGKSILILHSMSAALLPELEASDIRPAGIVLIEGNLIAEDAEWCLNISTKSDDIFEVWFNRFKLNSTMVLRSQLKKQHLESDLIHWAEGFLQVDSTALRQIAKDLLCRSESGASLLAISKLNLPMLYLRGDSSPDWDGGRNMLDRLGVPVINISNSGHYPMLDNPLMTWSAISSLKCRNI